MLVKASGKCPWHWQKDTCPDPGESGPDMVFLYESLSNLLNCFPVLLWTNAWDLIDQGRPVAVTQWELADTVGMTGRRIATGHVLIIGAEFIGVAMQTGLPGRIGCEPDFVHGLEITLIALEIVRTEVVVAGGTASRRPLPFKFSHSVVTIDTVELMAGVVERHGMILIAVAFDKIDLQAVFRRFKFNGFGVFSLRIRILCLHRQPNPQGQQRGKKVYYQFVFHHHLLIPLIYQS